MSSSTTTTWPSNLLRVGDLTCVSRIELLDVAGRTKADPDGWADVLADQELACILVGSSTDTRLSAEVAAYRLGMIPIPLSPTDLELDHHDGLGDTARTLSSYASAVVAASVIDGRRSVVWEQAVNRVPAGQAVIYALSTATHEAGR